MLLFNKTIWDGVLYGTTEQFSDINLAALFGQAEKFVFHVRATQTTGTAPKVNINVYVSNDGESFVAKTVSPFQSGALTSSVINNLLVTDSGSTPNGAFIRFGIALANSDNVSNVRVIVSGRAEQNHL